MSSSKPKVLLLGQIEHASARSEYDSLSSLAQLITPKSSNPADFLAECRSGTFDGTRAVYRTFDSISITGRIEGDVVKALANAGIRFIAHNGAGYDQYVAHPRPSISVTLFQIPPSDSAFPASLSVTETHDLLRRIDVPACTTSHIHVSNVPTAVDAATADTALFLLLGALRNFNPSLLSLRSNQWRGNPPPPLGHDPQNKILGILGMGGIGRNLAAKARALGMEIWYHNRNKLNSELEAGATYKGFEELLEGCDVLSLNLPLNERTRGLIGKEEFQRMRRGAVLVNTARGGVVDEQALVDALNSSQISSCGLDVYTNEPNIHPGLVNNPKVMLLPHMGTWTEEVRFPPFSSLRTQTEMELWTIANVRSALETGRLKSRVPEQMDMPES
ncbi:MAG: hypothetical protein Q9220_003467 [cf. Caloplaca sp. 1 TL-2023]